VDLLLITGAGASRNLARGEGEFLPLMQDWANVLCDALDSAEGNLAGACGLTPGMPANDFEETIGALLEWRRVRWLEERFRLMGGAAVGSEHGEVAQHREYMGRRITRFIRVLNETLYAEFGQHRVDDQRAAEAYRNLFKALEVSELAVATTNYDRSGHAALAGLGQPFSTGFTRELSGRTPTFNIDELTKEGVTPYLHLHGAVGWYMKDGVVRDHGADQPFFEDFGIPVVLYPDPTKEPLNDETVSGLWRVFEQLLEEAERVLVMGHSLHDPALVRAIRAANPSQLAVTYFNEEETEQIGKQLPGARPLKVAFGPDLELSREWVKFRRQS
jgi:hypothetical protein